MNDLEREIQRLEQSKADLKTQIESKGGTVGAGTIDTYDLAVQSIPASYAPKYICFYMHDGTDQEFAADIAGVDTSQAKHICGITWDLNKTPSMYTPVPQSVTINWNTPALVDTSDMFSTPDRRSYSTIYLNELHQITITHLDTRHVTNMNGMFRGCRYVTELDLRALQFGTSTIEMYGMFNGCTALQNIQFSSSEMAKPSGLEYFCSNCQNLETINIDSWDFTNVTNMQNAFDNCKKLQALPNGANLFTNSCENYSSTFSNCKLITSVNSTGSIHSTPIKNMGYMFSGCTALTTAILPGFTAYGNCYYSSMFSGCTALTTVDLSNWNTSSAQSFDNMFQNCSSLTSLDLRSFTVRVGGNFSSVRGMFNGCTNLMHLDLRSFRFDRIPQSAYPLQMFGNTSGAVTIPTNCEIIVEDATQKTWLTTNYPTLTNVKTVAEASGLSIVSINGSYDTGTETGEVVVTFSENITGNGPDHGEDPVEVYYDDGQGTLYSWPFYMSDVTISGATMTCPIPDNYLESYILDGTARFRMVAGFVEGTSTSTLNQAVDSTINWTVTN